MPRHRYQTALPKRLPAAGAVAAVQRRRRESARLIPQLRALYADETAGVLELRDADASELSTLVGDRQTVERLAKAIDVTDSPIAAVAAGMAVPPWVIRSVISNHGSGLAFYPGSYSALVKDIARHAPEHFRYPERLYAMALAYHHGDAITGVVNSLASGRLSRRDVRALGTYYAHQGQDGLSSVLELLRHIHDWCAANLEEDIPSLAALLMPGGFAGLWAMDDRFRHLLDRLSTRTQEGTAFRTASMKRDGESRAQHAPMPVHIREFQFSLLSTPVSLFWHGLAAHSELACFADDVLHGGTILVAVHHHEHAAGTLLLRSDGGQMRLRSSSGRGKSPLNEPAAEAATEFVASQNQSDHTDQQRQSNRPFSLPNWLNEIDGLMDDLEWRANLALAARAGCGWPNPPLLLDLLLTHPPTARSLLAGSSPRVFLHGDFSGVFRKAILRCNEGGPLPTAPIDQAHD